MTTLSRQFQNLTRGDLKQIEDTLPSLLNGLKLIWTISRHISSKDEQMEVIMEAISNEICQKVRNQIDIKTIFKRKNMNSAIDDISQGIAVLDKWQTQFHETKMKVEQEVTIKRWEFSKIKEIFLKPKHMKTILEDLKKACIVKKEFQAILGPDLKEITSSSEEIERVAEQVEEQTRKLANFVNDVFNPAYLSDWKLSFQGFEQQVAHIENTTVHMINTAWPPPFAFTEKRS